MQVQGLYSIYDRKTQVYLPLYQATSDEQAHRAFVEVIMTSDTDVSKYPAEMDLVRLGALNIHTGQIEPEYPVGLLINGLVAYEAAIRDRQRYEAITRRIYDEKPSEDIPEAS